MLKPVVWWGMRLALLFSVALPPVVAFVCAECPNTVGRAQVCPSAPLGANCPAASDNCEGITWVVPNSDQCGCKSKGGSNTQCLDATQQARCYDQAPCREKQGMMGVCEKNISAMQTFQATKKSTESCN